MNEENFEEIWNLILANEGVEFQTIRGIPFTYHVKGNVLQIDDRAQYNLSQGNFLNALPFFHPNDLGIMPTAIVGRSYVWGIYNGLINQIQEF